MWTNHVPPDGFLQLSGTRTSYRICQSTVNYRLQRNLHWSAPHLAIGLRQSSVDETFKVLGELETLRVTLFHLYWNTVNK